MNDPVDIIILIAHLVFAFGFLGLCLYFKKNIPKSINGWYGYRTASSLKSQATWDAANHYSAKVMLYIAFAYCLMTAVSYFTLEGMNSFQFCAIVLAVLPLLAIVFTEMHLKKNFDKEGNKIHS